MPSKITADSTAIHNYYRALREAEHQQELREGSVRHAFENLLRETAKDQKGWMLVAELGEKRERNRVEYDGVLRDENRLPHGWWEAKDTKDDLDAEIQKKRGRGYRFDNILFEDTLTGVLFQNGLEVLRRDLRQPDQLADLLNRFYSHEIEPFKKFSEAVTYFQNEIPHIAGGLKEKIEAAHQDNRKFKAAFDEFMEMCRAALNPNLSQSAADEMLIQHMLTERLIRKVFDVEEFTRRNVIAAEIEKVIDSLASQHFNRHEFLGALDRFYTAIEDAADKLATFSEKQDFINHVYERFFQGYSVKIADTHGIVYTPQPIVDFMCAAVEEVLLNEFGKKLGDDGVYVIDPCTGTGNFAVNLLRRAHERNPRHFERFYREQLFANEVMLMPYYIASLNLEHEYYALTGHYESFEGICFVDTLDLAQREQLGFAFMNEKNTARVERQKQAPITVVIGNPPYNANQQNENDNNKNRKYEVIDKRVAETYARDSKASNKIALSDPYVKFFRWAVDRLQGRDGVICYVSNNSFVDQIAFDGMRKHLMQDFTAIYHLDLHGNVRQNPKLSGTAHNVFGIQVGVGITVAVRSSNPHPASPASEGGVGTRSATPSLFTGRAGEGVPSTPETWSKWHTSSELWEKIKPLAAQMRQNPTAAENHLWQRLRRHQVMGYKFRRQHTIDRFIADFYCHEAQLVIEVDGTIHEYTQEEDALRTAFLESQGLRMLRFTNGEVLQQTDAVVERIGEVLLDLTSHTNADPHPASGVNNNPHLTSPASEGGVGSADATLSSFTGSSEAVRLSNPHPASGVNNNPHLTSPASEGGVGPADATPSPFTGRAGEGFPTLSTGEATMPIQRTTAHLFYHRVPEFWRKDEKLAWLDKNVEEAGRQNALNTVSWAELIPDNRQTWLIPEHADEFATFLPIGNKETKSGKGNSDVVFKTYGRGVATSRDDTVYDFKRSDLAIRIQKFIDNYNAEVDRYNRAGKPKDVDDFVKYDNIKWSRDLKLDLQRGNYAQYSDAKVRTSLYRPFCKRNIFFDRVLNEEVYVLPSIFPTTATEQENIVICVTDLGSEKPFMTLISTKIADLHLVGAGASCQCFPFYVYDADGTNRRENITDWALAQFRPHYGDESISKWDIFYTVYGLLHHPDYRTKFADNLKRELPRIPYAPDFRAFAEAGKKLADLHLNYETVEPYELEWVTKPGTPISYRVEKMRMNKDKTS